MIWSNSEEGQEIMRGLGIDPETTMKAVVTFEAGKPVLIERQGVLPDGAVFVGQYMLVQSRSDA